MKLEYQPVRKLVKSKRKLMEMIHLAIAVQQKLKQGLSNVRPIRQPT